jgi:hypothetical protein
LYFAMFHKQPKFKKIIIGNPEGETGERLP